jgi:glycosyltransferase involved in cell wall biosynthesis
MISIIIPMYNRATLVSETLDSVFAQTYTDWECIVVDDGSTDHSVAVVQKYVDNDSRFKLLIRPENRIKGAPTCRNIGFENSNGEYVYFLDSDDLLSPEFSQTVLNGLSNYPDAEYAAFPFDGFLESPSKPTYYSRKFSPNKGTLFEQIMMCHVHPTTQTFIWKSSLLDRVTMLWQEGLPCCQDSDFTQRMVCEASTGIWLKIPCLVHVRRNNIDSIGGNNKKDIIKFTQTLLFYLDESFYNCCQKKLMSNNIHKGLQYMLLRQQLIAALLYCESQLQELYYGFIKKIAQPSLYDKFVCITSRMIITMAPLLYVIGNICCRLPIIGKNFVRAKRR